MHAHMEVVMMIDSDIVSVVDSDDDVDDDSIGDYSSDDANHNYHNYVTMSL